MRLFPPHGTTPYLPSFEQVGRFRGIGMMQTTVQEAISILKAHVCKMPLFTITDDSNLENMLVKSHKLLVLLIDVVNTLITIEFPKRPKRVFRAAEVSDRGNIRRRRELLGVISYGRRVEMTDQCLQRHAVFAKYGDYFRHIVISVQYAHERQSNVLF